jgi:amidohydrolase
MPAPDVVKDRICEAVDRWADELIGLSHRLHANPELAFDEHYAHDQCTELLEKAGHDVVRGAHGLATAFAMRCGGEGSSVAVLCEYDALPHIGHACGHNIIATAGLGAALAAAEVAGDLGGRLLSLGTPAEEGGGGKALLADRGAFDGVDAAVMVHPAGVELTRMKAIAAQQLVAVYEGAAAHAAAAPERGRNALDGAVLGYVNCAALRQHIRPDERIHGIFTEAGEAANFVPDRASAHWFVRSPTVDLLEPLVARVRACLEAGAAAAGVSCEITSPVPVYADMVDNEPLVAAYVANAGRIGRTVVEPGPTNAVVASTDMGNVSQIVPSIHPMIAVAPPNVAIHTEAFAEHAASATADRAVLDGAKALAMTVADFWADSDLRAAAADAFSSEQSL